MTTEQDWRAQVGRSWAQNYALTDRSFTGLTQVLLDRAAPMVGRSVLDVGCGAGELSLALARQNPGAQVLGIDISADLVEVARARASGVANARFVEADAGARQGTDFAADLVVSRHGVMFFADPVSAFANIRSDAGKGARLLFSCFRTPAENAWAAGLAEVLGLAPSPNPRAPGPFAFAEASYVQGILTEAGWQDPGFEAVDFAYVAGSGEDPVEDALGLFRRIGPAALHLRNLAGAELEEAETRMRAWLERHRSGNLVAMAGAAWIVTAHSD